MNFDKWRHYLRARLFHLLRDDERALSEYRLALAAAPDYAHAAACIAYIYAQRKQYAAAADYFRRALQSQPGDAELHFNLGYVSEKNGALEQAIAAFQQAVKLDPKLDRAWYGLGICEARRGDHEAAARALQEAATLQPMNPHAWYALGMACHHLHQPDKVKEVVLHLHRFDPRMARELIKDAERGDLAYLVEELRV